MQSDNTDNMMFPVVEMLVYITQGMTLEPGDIIFTGTPSGVGHARKPPVWMKNGDVCEVEIARLGVLRNPIADEKVGMRYKMLRGKAAHGGALAAGSPRAWRSSSSWRSWPSPALRQEPVRIGMGFGLAFLPIFICEDLKLIEKHGKESHLDLKPPISAFSAPARCKTRWLRAPST